MEVILTIGVLGILIIFFRKILSIITKIVFTFILGSLLALFTEATMASGIFMVFGVIQLNRSTWKSFFEVLKKIITRSKRYKNGFLEKIVDILFSININLMSVIWSVVFIHIGIEYSFNIEQLISVFVSAALSIGTISCFKKVLLK